MKMLRLLLIVLALALCLSPPVAAKPKPIDQNQSKLGVRIDGLDSGQVRYRYLGWNETYAYERYAAIYRDPATGQFLQAVVAIVANDEYYWSGAAPMTVEEIKKARHFRGKSITVTYRTDGANAFADSAAGGPNFVLFTADGVSCTMTKRFSTFGPHGGTTEPYAISAYYCAPRGRTVTRDQARAIAKDGLFVIRKPVGGNP